jgi:hypothetical protein
MVLKIKKQSVGVFLLLLLQFFPLLLGADKYPHWFVGPLLAPNPRALPVGHPALEISATAFENYGEYNAHWKIQDRPSIWSFGPYIDFQISVNKIFGVEYIGALFTNFSEGAHYTHLQDSVFRFGFQISRDREDSWVPDFRILFQETVPTGKYKNLNPNKHGTDSTGLGSFQTGVHFAMQKLMHVQKNHDLRIRGTLGYFVPASVGVTGLNCYGGNSNTKGDVYPGQYLIGYLCGEYGLSNRCSIALESNYKKGWKGGFKKRKGLDIKVPAYDQFSLAPEFQYTFTPNTGMLVGSWFTVAGKNSMAFRSYFIMILWVF